MIIGKCPICGEEMRIGSDMTNADRIRSMTDEELAEFINMVWGNGRAAREPSNGWAEWLKEEEERWLN